MTGEDLLKIQSEVKKRSRDLVRNALYELDRYSTVREIWNLLDEKTRKAKLVNKNKKDTINIKTIERRVKDDPIIEKKGITYRIIPEAKTDLRNFPSFVGEIQLADIIIGLKYCPAGDTFKNNLKQLVNIFGVYLVYRFLIAAKPVNNAIVMSNDEKDELALRWLKDTIDLTNIFEYFLLVIRNQQFNDNIIQSFRKKYKEGKIEKKDLPENLDNLLIRHLKTYQRRKDMDPRYQLQESEIDRVNSVLEKLYHNIYHNLRNSRFYPVSFDPKSDLFYDESKLKD